MYFHIDYKHFTYGTQAFRIDVKMTKSLDKAEK